MDQFLMEVQLKILMLMVLKRQLLKEQMKEEQSDKLYIKLSVCT